MCVLAKEFNVVGGAKKYYCWLTIYGVLRKNCAIIQTQCMSASIHSELIRQLLIYLSSAK